MSKCAVTLHSKLSTQSEIGKHDFQLHKNTLFRQAEKHS